MITPMHRNFNIALSIILLLLVLVISACTAQEPSAPEAKATEPPLLSVGSCTLPLPQAPSDEDATRALLVAEGELVVKQNIESLMDLWNDGAHITDAKNTALDLTDDQHWLDKDAIRHRYVRTVFPGAPTVAMPKDLIITIDNLQATITATTQIGNEISPAGDRWELVKKGDCWVIESLTYNLESTTN